jgi:hypothetical protein
MNDGTGVERTVRKLTFMKSGMTIGTVASVDLLRNRLRGRKF